MKGTIKTLKDLMTSNSLSFGVAVQEKKLILISIDIGENRKEEEKSKLGHKSIKGLKKSSN